MNEALKCLLIPRLKLETTTTGYIRGYWGYILGLYRVNGKENGNYYIIMGCIYIYSNTQAIAFTWTCPLGILHVSAPAVGRGQVAQWAPKFGYLLRKHNSKNCCRLPKVRPTGRSQPRSHASSNMAYPSSPVDSPTNVPRPPGELKGRYSENATTFLRYPGQWKSAFEGLAPAENPLACSPLNEGSVARNFPSADVETKQAR